ncbi:MAG: DUF5696 domain-containing protein [Acholeplasmataceae bacterium]|nr:DUF5696 domain-containing protein [Acholeplasmataceae bacterium]
MRAFKLTITLVLSLFLIVPFSNTQNNYDLVVREAIAPKESSLTSSKYTQVETDLRVATNPFIDTLDYHLVGSLGDLSFYFKEEDLSFRIKDNKSDYLWGSSFNFDYLDENSPLHDEGDFGANESWKKRFSSPLIINYYQETNLRDEHLFSNGLSDFESELIVAADKVGFQAKLDFYLSKIELELMVYLDLEGLHIEIPASSIKEKGSVKLSSIQVYPFFGAVKRDRIPGYTFIPDGTGALMRYDDQKRSSYTKRYYGPDLGLNYETNEKFLTLNTFGVVQGINQNAFLTVIDSGASHAILTFSPSLVGTDFNHTFITYTYRTDYTQYLNQSKTSSIKLVQKNKNEIDIKQSYYFLNGEDANYLGMAKKYQSLLIEDGVLKRQEEGNIPLHLDVLMSESKKAFIGRKVFPMTTYNYLNEVIKELEQEIDKLIITLYGWQNGGYSYSAPNYQRFTKVSGSKEQLKELLKTEHDIYLEMDVIKVYHNSKGYKKSEIAQSIGQELINEDDYFYLKPASALKKLTTLEKRFSNYGEGIMLSSLDTIYSDFATETTREEQIAIIKEMLDVSDKTMISEPLGYLLKADVILNTQMYSSLQTKFDDTVPFLPLVLMGYKDAFSRNANFFSNTVNELLRMIDYHLYPSFIITEKASHHLLNTGSENIYTSEYQSWKEAIISEYHFVNDALRFVKDATLNKREILAPGFVKNSYDNGVIIYINYSGKSHYDGDILIEPTSYEVIL